MATSPCSPIVSPHRLDVPFSVIQNIPAWISAGGDGGVSGLVIPGQALPASGRWSSRSSPACRTPLRVVIEGTGPGPQLPAVQNSLGWEGQLILPNPTSLRRGPTRLALAEAGFRDNSLEGEGRPLRHPVKRR